MVQKNLAEHFLEQLSPIIESYDGFKSQSKYDDVSDVMGLDDVHSLITRSRAAIERITGSKSAYSKQIEETLERQRVTDYDKLAMIIGVAKSLKADLEAGYLASFEELIHSSLFADFLEMANYLLDEGYKDAASVIAGGTLEAHLRQLCAKNEIDTEVSTSKGMRPKKADRMNTDLAKASVYSKLDQKNVTAWLDLRNKAAHGQYSSYTKEQVALFITGIRDFITRNPA